MKRTGTSLSLSENEMDSDIEVDLTLAIKQHQNQKSSRSTPQSPVSMAIDNIDGHNKINSITQLVGDSKSLEHLSSRSSSIATQQDNEDRYDNETKTDKNYEHETDKDNGTTHKFTS